MLSICIWPNKSPNDLSLCGDRFASAKADSAQSFVILREYTRSLGHTVALRQVTGPHFQLQDDFLIIFPLAGQRKAILSQGHLDQCVSRFSFVIWVIVIAQPEYDTKDHRLWNGMVIADKDWNCTELWRLDTIRHGQHRKVSANSKWWQIARLTF